MTIENHLSKKTYYETLCTQENKVVSIEELGQMFLEENKKEFADLSYIRFAQGEVYYQYQDYEAAIFKWENISNELEAWAKKNVGDAYFELNLFPSAIDTLKSIETDNVTLLTEIDLKLFQIYIEEEKRDLAIKHIKSAISLNPDYQRITEIARIFFEQNKDWNHAVELAVTEAIRTERIYWVDTLIEYAEKGNTKNIEPAYFSSLLEVVYRIDETRFEKLVCSLWESYQYDESYVQWIRSINEILSKVNVKESTGWKELSKVFNNTFIDLIAGGRYELKDLTNFMPKLLENWVYITKPSQALAAYSALLAWNEFFPNVISEQSIHFAESNIWESTNNPHVLEDILELFYEMTQWAGEQEVEIANKLRWLIQEILDINKQNILIIGVNGTGKSTFLNSVLKEELFQSPTRNTVRIKHGDTLQMTVVSDHDMYSDTDIYHLQDVINGNQKLESRIITDVAIPSEVLRHYGITLIDTPGFRGKKDEEEVTEFLPLADYLLFVLDAEDPFTEQERDILLNIKQIAPHLSVAFVITKLDTIYNKQEAKKIVDETAAKIVEYEPDAKVIAFSSKYEVAGQEKEITKLFASLTLIQNQKEKRANQLLQVVRRTIVYLLQKREEKENGLAKDILWNEDLLNKLNGAINQLQDYEKGSADALVSKYRVIKTNMKNEMEKYIPQMLKDCGELLKENSDFRKVHLVLNEEMNKKIQAYVEDRVIPRFYNSLQEWIIASKSELESCKLFLNEMSESFNGLYGKEKLGLQGDFRILDDWNRDINRMTSGIKVDNENILLRHTPSQLLLKSAGKLFGAIPQNKSMLYNQYKKFVENENYLETTSSVISKFMLSFEMFEKVIERDLNLFFTAPIKELKASVEEAHEEIKLKEDLLNVMKENPEFYHDALTLFEIRLRQYEWMNGTNENRE